VLFFAVLLMSIMLISLQLSAVQQDRYSVSKVCSSCHTFVDLCYVMLYSYVSSDCCCSISSLFLFFFLSRDLLVTDAMKIVKMMTIPQVHVKSLEIVEKVSNIQSLSIYHSDLNTTISYVCGYCCRLVGM